MLAQAFARTVPRRPRGEKKPIPSEQRDDRYYERRKRNNLAAKKSRDQRKTREDTIAVRATFLEKENAALRTAVSALREVFINNQVRASEHSKNSCITHI
jgi:hypothetical protein